MRFALVAAFAAMTMFSCVRAPVGLSGLYTCETDQDCGGAPWQCLPSLTGKVCVHPGGLGPVSGADLGPAGPDGGVPDLLLRADGGPPPDVDPVDLPPADQGGADVPAADSGPTCEAALDYCVNIGHRARCRADGLGPEGEPERCASGDRCQSGTCVDAGRIEARVSLDGFLTFSGTAGVEVYSGGISGHFYHNIRTNLRRPEPVADGSCRVDTAQDSEDIEWTGTPFDAGRIDVFGLPETDGSTLVPGPDGQPYYRLEPEARPEYLPYGQSVAVTVRDTTLVDAVNTSFQLASRRFISAPLHAAAISRSAPLEVRWEPVSEDGGFLTLTFSAYRSGQPWKVVTCRVADSGQYTLAAEHVGAFGDATQAYLTLGQTREQPLVAPGATEARIVSSFTHSRDLTLE